MATRQAAKGKRSKRRSGRSALAIGGVAAVVVLLATGVGIIITTSGSSSEIGAPVDGVAAPAASGSTPLQPTGEVSSMGVPVVETPGYASGAVEVDGVAVQGADWALGQVPLNVAVRPFWTITNTGTQKVVLGEPKAEVRQGCCPGPLVLGQDTLAPGESTVLTFELSMHEGMDGWHDMGVYVPVDGASGQDWLELNVTGDFRN
jgi:hypothetical protein